MFIDFIFFREKGSVGVGEERETLIQLPPICTPTGDQTHNLGMCPDQELKLQPFGVWDNAPTNRATRPGHSP